MTKTVSVIIPTYKRPTFLPRAIQSVLNSTYKNVEVIVVDDNNDGDEFRALTEKVMASFLDENDNIKYVKHKVNKNGSAARNTGFKNSSGEYLMFLDDDDEFLPTKIEAQVNRMEQLDSSWGACYTRYIDVSKDGKLRYSAETAEGSLLVKELSRNLFVHAGSNLMVRRSVYEEVGGFDESFTRNQDIEFLIKVLKQYKLAFADCVGLKVYLHDRGNIDYEVVTEHFIATFKAEIDAQSEEDQRAIYKMIALQRIRAAISTRNINLAKKIKNETSIGFFDISMYFLHLAGRMITRKSKGYPMRYLY